MKNRHQKNYPYLIIFFIMIAIAACNKSQYSEIVLDSQWEIQSSKIVDATGDSISMASYKPQNWIPTNVPATVLGALVDNGIFKEPFVGRNLESIPTGQFKSSWWYRKVFDLKNCPDYEHASIHLNGINFAANIWLNGKKIAASDTFGGAYRIRQVDISKYLQKSQNILAIEVIPPKLSDYSIAFVDWNPRPPDESMGIFRPVTIKLNGKVSLQNIYVSSKVNIETLKEAELTIEAEAINHCKDKITTTVTGVIENINFKQEVELLPFEHKKITFNPDNCNGLKIKEPRIWWPYLYGEPNMYTLNLSCDVKGNISDNQHVDFGIRQVSNYINAFGAVGYIVNGKKVQIRGGGWTDEIFLRENKKNLEAQIQYTKLMNLNTIRLEGFWGNGHDFYNLCDKNGILVMVGISCQWEWSILLGGKAQDDFGTALTPQAVDSVANMVRDQILMLRNHPSIYVWALGSDKNPSPELESRYLKDLKEIDNTRPTLMSCSKKVSKITGPTGTKMLGPYNWVSPNYWYVDKIRGGAFGFNTETGPGAQFPTIETMKKMLPADKLWPENNNWEYHFKGIYNMRGIGLFTRALNNRYGKADNLPQFLQKAQIINYEASRAMFEAHSVNRDTATGIIQWMLNAAWPKILWQLYDYYLMPNAAFFGTQSACKPINIIYNYGNGGIYATNDYYAEKSGLTAEIKVYDLDSKELMTQKTPITLKENSSQKISDLPNFVNTPVSFLNMRILDKNNKVIATNFYWISSKKDVIFNDPRPEAWASENIEFADFTSLNNLAKTSIIASLQVADSAEKVKIKVNLKNTTNKIAFFLEMKVKSKSTKELVLPVFWSDNYVSLLPNEERMVSVEVNKEDLHNEKPIVEIEGFNTPLIIID